MVQSAIALGLHLAKLILYSVNLLKQRSVGILPAQTCYRILLIIIWEMGGEYWKRAGRPRPYDQSICIIYLYGDAIAKRLYSRLCIINIEWYPTANFIYFDLIAFSLAAKVLPTHSNCNLSKDGQQTSPFSAIFE